MTSYEVVYGQQPPTVTTYIPGTSKVQSIDTIFQYRTNTLEALKDNLHMDKKCMKKQTDQHCSERVFQEVDQVFLRLQPYKKKSLKAQGHHKLAPKFYGSYQTIKHIGWMAYKLALIATSKIHPVWTCLNKVVGQNCRVQTILSELDEEGSLWLQPEVFLSILEHQLRGRTINEVLI